MLGRRTVAPIGRRVHMQRKGCHAHDEDRRGRMNRAAHRERIAEVLDGTAGGAKVPYPVGLREVTVRATRMVGEVLEIVGHQPIEPASLDTEIRRTITETEAMRLRFVDGPNGPHRLLGETDGVIALPVMARVGRTALTTPSMAVNVLPLRAGRVQPRSARRTEQASRRRAGRRSFVLVVICDASFPVSGDQPILRSHPEFSAHPAAQRLEHACLTGQPDVDPFSGRHFDGT